MTLTAITLWRPMAAAIVWGSKRIENRRRDLPKRMRGVPTIIAVHAGKKYDGDYWQMVRAIDGDAEGRVSYYDRIEDEGIVGLMLLSGRVFTKDFLPTYGARPGEYTNPWWGGPFGYEIAATFAFEKPIPCRGMQGWWPVSDDVEAQVPASARTALVVRAPHLAAALHAA